MDRRFGLGTFTRVVVLFFILFLSLFSYGKVCTSRLGSEMVILYNVGGHRMLFKFCEEDIAREGIIFVCEGPGVYSSRGGVSATLVSYYKGVLLPNPADVILEDPK